MMKPQLKSSLFDRSSSSSSDEDAPDRDQRPRQFVGIPCKNGSCGHELLCVNNSEYYCSRECYHSKLERDQVGETGIQMRRITINGRGGTGLLRDRKLLDHLTVKVDNLIGRVVTVQNSGAAASRWKKQSGKKDRGSLNKVVDEAKQTKSEEDQRRLKALLNFDEDDTSEETTSSGEEDDRSKMENPEEAHEEIRTILSSDVSSSICPIHPPVGKKGTHLKGYIIGIVSPWQLYVQTEEMVIMTEKIEEICNRPEGIDPRSVLPLWLPSVGGYCTAKYEDGKLYRAKILEKLDNNILQVKFIDYGNIGLVPQSDVSQLNPEVTLTPRQNFFFKMSNVKPRNGERKWSTEVCQFLMEHLDGGVVEIELESVERGIIHWGRVSVISSLSGEVEGDLGKILVERKLADPDSFYL